MDSINIPPAALEAGARATLEELDAIAGLIGATRVDGELTPEQQEFFRRIARAAFEAMVKNWDGAFKNRSGDYVMFHLSDALILPVPMESLNDKP